MLNSNAIYNLYVQKKNTHVLAMGLDVLAGLGMY
jgi:hypothetical protein